MRIKKIAAYIVAVMIAVLFAGAFAGCTPQDNTVYDSVTVNPKIARKILETNMKEDKEFAENAKDSDRYAVIKIMYCALVNDAYKNADFLSVYRNCINGNSQNKAEKYYYFIIDKKTYEAVASYQYNDANGKVEREIEHEKSAWCGLSFRYLFHPEEVFKAAGMEDCNVQNVYQLLPYGAFHSSFPSYSDQAIYYVTDKGEYVLHTLSNSYNFMLQKEEYRMPGDEFYQEFSETNLFLTPERIRQDAALMQDPVFKEKMFGIKPGVDIDGCYFVGGYTQNMVKFIDGLDKFIIQLDPPVYIVE